MTTSLRVLIIEDDPDDADLIVHELRRAGFEPFVDRLEDEMSFREHLARGIGIILADYTMPGFGAARSLEIMAETRLDIPVIVVTGTIGEEAAVECMRQGAADVIFKDRLWALGPAVSRVLDDARARRSQLQLQATLTESETRFRMITELNSDFAYALREGHDAILRWEWTTGTFGNLLSVEADALPDVGGWLTVAHPEDVERVKRHYAAIRTGNPSEAEFRIVTPGGTIRHLRDHARAVRDDGGLLIYGSAKDVTEWKQIGSALRASEERFRHLFDHAADSILVYDRAGRLTDANRRARESLGLPRETLAGLTIADIDPNLPVERLAELWDHVAHGAQIAHEGTYRRADGTPFDVEVRHTALEAGGERLLVAFARDISGRKRAEAAIRRSEERYRRIVETAQEAILLIEPGGRIAFVNQRTADLLGYSEEELIGAMVSDFLDEQSRRLVEAKMAGRRKGVSDQYDLRIRHKDGSDVWTITSASPLMQDGEYTGTLVMLTDITERKHAEDELMQAQKLESVGRLAAGIAHEINTPIQFVGDNVTFLRDSFASLGRLVAAQHALRDAVDPAAVDERLVAELDTAEDEADFEYLVEEVPKAIEQTLDGVARVATIVRAMKEFAHPDQGEAVAVDLNHALQSTLTVARNELKYVADVETEFGDLPSVVCRPGAINQVFLNLLVNAAHAIADRPRAELEKGTIRVTTARERDQVVVAIGDDGCGIPDAIRTKVFEQFFTTKQVGRGTGQGLALARQVVVEQHGGSLTFDSEVGRGTTFYVRLPIDRHAQADAA